MKSNNLIKKIAAGVMSAAMLFTGSPLARETGVSFFADQTAITASAASFFDSHDPHNLGSNVTVYSGHKRLNVGDYLTNGNYKAIMQSDGNFVVYEYYWQNGQKKNRAKWCSSTALQGAYRNYHIDVQEDENLVIYATPSNYTSREKAIWCTGTDNRNNKGAHTLKLESNGTLSLYRGSNASGTRAWTNSGNKVSWCIDVKTQNNPAYRSNLIYPYTGETIWGVGCALASTTMIYNYYKGTNVNPTALNNSTYLDGNSWLRWNNVKATDERDRIFSCNELANRLKSGPVIVYIGYKHFIVVHRCTKASGTFTTDDFRVIDPANTYNGSSNMTLSQAMNKIGAYSIVQMDYWSQSAGRSMPNV